MTLPTEKLRNRNNRDEELLPKVEEQSTDRVDSATSSSAPLAAEQTVNEQEQPDERQAPSRDRKHQEADWLTTDPHILPPAQRAALARLLHFAEQIDRLLARVGRDPRCVDIAASGGVFAARLGLDVGEKPAHSEEKPGNGGEETAFAVVLRHNARLLAAKAGTFALKGRIGELLMTRNGVADHARLCAVFEYLGQLGREVRGLGLAAAAASSSSSRTLDTASLSTSTSTSVSTSILDCDDPKRLAEWHESHLKEPRSSTASSASSGLIAPLSEMPAAWRVGPELPGLGEGVPVPRAWRTDVGLIRSVRFAKAVEIVAETPRRTAGCVD